MALTVAHLQQLAAARLDDAEALYTMGRYDAAAYLAGYAVEVALKARLCLTLGWTGFPETAREFEGLKSLKTHNLRILLRLSGRLGGIMATHPLEWTDLERDWSPEMRYRSVGTVSQAQVRRLIDAVRTIVGAL